MKYVHILTAAGVLALAAPAYAQIGLDIGQSADVRADTEVRAQQSTDANGTSTDAEARGGVGVDVSAEARTQAETSAQQRNESDMDFARERQSGANLISVSAREMNDMDAEAKQEFLATVKTHAQVQSGQDLEHFARGVLAADANVEAVEASETQVEVRYRVPAKFLGIFDSTLPARITVEAAGEGDANVSISERVRAKFPWTRIFFSLSEETGRAALEQAVEAELESELSADAGAEAGGPMSVQARVIQSISAALKAKHASSVQ